MNRFSDWGTSTIEIIRRSPTLDKAKKYINEPTMAPEGVQVQQGPKGGWYYETTSKKPSSNSSSRESLGFYQDNPLKNDPDSYGAKMWMEDNPNGITGKYTNIAISPKNLVNLRGRMGEENHIDMAKVNRLAANMQEHGFDPNQRVQIEIDQKGNPFIYEGNHRIRAAVIAGIDKIPVDVNYLGGSEEIPNVFDPANFPETTKFQSSTLTFNPKTVKKVNRLSDPKKGEVSRGWIAPDGQLYELTYPDHYAAFNHEGYTDPLQSGYTRVYIYNRRGTPSIGLLGSDQEAIRNFVMNQARGNEEITIEYQDKKGNRKYIDTSVKSWFEDNLAMSLDKAREYIPDPSYAPPGIQVEQGKRGGYYYDTRNRPNAQPIQPTNRQRSVEPNVMTFPQQNVPQPVKVPENIVPTRNQQPQVAVQEKPPELAHWPVRYPPEEYVEPEHIPHPPVKDRYKLTPTKERAWDGYSRVPIKYSFTSNNEQGKMAESLAASYIDQVMGIPDVAAHESTDSVTLAKAIDLIGDHRSFEIKGAKPSNSVGARQWRITPGEQGQWEKDLVFSMKPAERKFYLKNRDQLALNRKLLRTEEIGRQKGTKILPTTLTMIFNPDTRVVDMYEFDGFDLILNWNKYKDNYVGSYKYDDI